MTDTRRTRVRPLADADMPLVHSLYSEVFGAGPLDLWRRRWSWQFRDSPAAKASPARCWVAELDGEITGFVASFPARLWVRDHLVNILWACDLMVSSRAAGHGLGYHLIRAYLNSEDNPLPNALQYSPANGLIHELLRYEKMWIQPVFLRVYNVSAMGKAALAKSTHRGDWKQNVARAALPPASAAMMVARALRTPRIRSGISVRRVTDPGGEFDTLWQSARGEFPLIPVRDRAWVAWRFAADPLTKHTILLAQDRGGQPVGYTALSGTTRRGLSVGRIMDVFASPRRPDVTEALLAEALAIFESQTFDVVSCMGLHPALRQVVGRYLFLAPRQLHVSARLQWKGDPALRTLIFDPKAWHLSYADGDEAFG